MADRNIRRSQQFLSNLRNVLVPLVILHLLAQATPVSGAPTLTGADRYVLPEGESITLTGSGLTGANAAHLFWLSSDFAATVNPVNDNTLQVVMPNVFQDIRDHLLLVETPGGSTFGIPSAFANHTTTGSPPEFPSSPTRVIVVRAGATLSSSINADLVFVETGGVYQAAAGSSVRLIAAASGAYIDFQGVTSLSSCRFFKSPDTVILGSNPTGVTTRQLTPIRASYGIETFTVGYPVNITTVGGGVVSRSPDQTYYRLYDYVSLTAAPDAGYTFSGWSGAANSSQNPLSVQVVNAPLNITATFSPGWVLDLIDVPGVTVTRSPAGPTYPNGTSVTLTATVASGYEFLGWGGDLSGPETTITFNIIGNTTVVPIVRPNGYALLPQISAADRYVLPEGETITLTGSGLTGTNAAHLFWQAFDFPSAINPVSDSSLGVVFPNVQQDIRDHLLLVETTGGSTFGIPSAFVDHTTDGPLPPELPPSSNNVIVVRAGATLTGSIHADFVYVETGGIFKVAAGGSIRRIAGENGAVIDFRGVSSLSSCRFFKSPGTVILGSNPTGVTTRQLTPIRVSYGIETFTVGYPVNITTVGGGTVSRNPDQAYYRIYDSVSLTAAPDTGYAFSGWSGAANSFQNPLSLQVVNAPLNITATFSPGWVLDPIDVPGVTVTRSPVGPTYPDGTSVTLTATAASGYEFLGWGGDLSGSETTITFNITGNTTVVPILRPNGYSLLPQITAADRYVLPEGETITLTGSGLTGTNAAHLFWQIFDFPSAINPISDSSLGVVFPNVQQDIRDHLLLVETTGGSTFGIPSAFVDHTTDGPLPPELPPSSNNVIVVRAGATLTGSIHADFVYVETGGIFKVAAGGSIRRIAGENGAVIDFRGVTSLSSCRFFKSPDTVVLGSVPTGVITRQLTPIRASYGIGTFTVGYPLNLTVEGPGTVTVVPMKDYYAANEQITLTAIPNAGAFFIRWIGPLSGYANPGTFSIRNGSSQIARFSTAPDFFTVWRLEHFTIEELADVNISALSADPDGDSLTNAAEYAFGSDPRVRDSKSKLRTRREKVNGEFIFLLSYTRPKNALDVTYVAQFSKNTVTWTSNGDETGILYSQEISVTDVDADMEEVTLQLYPGSEPPKTFFVRIDALIFD
ncbi:MAG: hypothetical protein V4819_19830 [Verrucomicrobiota bacterium]